MSPLELGLHLLVLWFHPPYPFSALLLATASTALAMWVFEPAAVRALRAWLQVPGGAGTRRLHEASSLWRVRVTVRDQPGALERLAHAFAAHDLNVLGVHSHTLPHRVLDEFVLAAP
ncbi:ACT domain-containing protein [Geodermatophilus sp. SYSU D00708]